MKTLKSEKSALYPTVNMMTSLVLHTKEDEDGIDILQSISGEYPMDANMDDTPIKAFVICRDQNNKILLCSPSMCPHDLEVEFLDYEGLSNWLINSYVMELDAFRNHEKGDLKIIISKSENGPGFDISACNHDLNMQILLAEEDLCGESDIDINDVRYVTWKTTPTVDLDIIEEVFH